MFTCVDNRNPLFKSLESVCQMNRWVCWEGIFFNWFIKNKGSLPKCQRFRKFRSEFKWKGPFRFLPTGIFGITSGGGPLISVGIFRSKFRSGIFGITSGGGPLISVGIFRSIFAVPFLTNRFFALIREFGNDKQWQELFLLVGAV